MHVESESTDHDTEGLGSCEYVNYTHTHTHTLQHSKHTGTNLQEHCDASVRKFREFNRSYREERERQSEVLESFDSALETLCEIRLHPEIRDVGKLTLIDSVSVTKFKEWASELNRSRKRLELKIAELSEVYLATSDGVRCLNVPLKLTFSTEKEENEDEEDATWSVSEFGHGERQDDDDERGVSRNDELRRNVEVLRNLLETLQERVIGRLESDVSKIREMIRTTTIQYTGENNHVREMVRDLCNKLETTHRVHQDELLPQLHAMDTSVMCAVSTCAQHHTKLMERMRNKMYLVSVLQSRIRDQGVRLAAIRAAFDQTRDGMQELNHVRHMPKAYVASLREVAKRRAYKKRYVKKLEDFSECMARMVHVETLRRDMFVKNHYVHLPQDLIPDLTSRPSNCQIRTREFDSKLPNIKEMSSKELTLLCGGTSYELCCDNDDDEGEHDAQNENKKNDSEDEIARLRNELETQRNLCEKYETRIKILEQRRDDKTLDTTTQSCSELVLSLKTLLDRNDEDKILDRVRELQMNESKYKDMLSEILLVMRSSKWNTTTANEFKAEESSSNDVIRFLTNLSSRHNLLQADLKYRDIEIEKLKKMLSTKLSFRDFAVGDVALFLPAKVYYDVERTMYVAFHRSCPRRFLSEECIDRIICKNGNRAPDFILGRITKIDVKVAISSKNDFSVPLGETYSLLDVVELDVDSV